MMQLHFQRIFPMTKFNRAVFVRDVDINPRPKLFANLVVKLRNLPDLLWWKYIPGTSIVVAWPRGSTTTDPNEAYRPILETYCGAQFIGWHWRTAADDSIEIKFRFGKSRWATLMAMRWA